MIRSVYERRQEPSFFSEYRVETAKNFCFAYGSTWMLLRADPFSAGVFMCLFGIINDYAKEYFDQYFSPNTSDALSLATAFVSAKVIGSLFGFHLTVKQALIVVLIVSFATHLIIYSFQDEKKSTLN